MVKLNIVANIKKLAKELDDIQKEQMPYALEQAMKITVQSGAKAAAHGARKHLDRPTPQVTRDKKSEVFTKRVFRYQYDNKKLIQAKGIDNAQASVFVVDYMTEEIAFQVFGGTARGVPEGTKGILTPTKALIKGIQGIGRLGYLNEYGNINELWKGALLKAAKRSEQFINVPLNNTVKRFEHLQPGLYVRVFSNSTKAYTPTYAANRRGRRQRRGIERDERGRFINTGGKRTQLVLLIAYESERRYKRKFPYDQIVMREYESVFVATYKKQLINAIKTGRKS